MDQKKKTEDKDYFEILKMYISLSEKGRHEAKKKIPDLKEFFEKADTKLKEMTSK